MSHSTPGRDTVRDLRTAMLKAGPACLDTALTDLFAPADVFEDEPDSARRAREKRAKTVCLSCPARAECLDYALALCPEEGVWAGLTVAQLRRRAIRLGRALVSGWEVSA
jgi:hypothetical protein